MKFICLKKSTIVIYTIFIFLIISSIFLTYIITKSNVDEKINLTDLENIDDENEFLCEDEEICNESPRKELLLKQYYNKKLIALTFDDGPSKYTETLVDELKKREVPVTFFILGENAVKRIDTLKFQIDAGNEIEIHSYTHKLFTKLKEEEILEQISKTKEVLKTVQYNDITYIRVPYGSRNKSVDKTLEKANLIDVLWSVDSKDWKFKNTNKTYNYVIKKIKGNDIILMHDTFKTSIEAAIKIVDKLQSECYTFVTISELYEIKNMVNSETKD